MIFVVTMALGPDYPEYPIFVTPHKALAMTHCEKDAGPNADPKWEFAKYGQAGEFQQGQFALPVASMTARNVTSAVYHIYEVESDLGQPVA